MTDPSLQEVVIDRRLLLRQLLQSLKTHGRRVKLPVGCDGYEDWLLDKLDVDVLLTRVAVGSEIDLMAVCRRSTSQGSKSASRRGSLLGRVTPRTPDLLADTAATPGQPTPEAGDARARGGALHPGRDPGPGRHAAQGAGLRAVCEHDRGAASAPLLRALRVRLGVDEARSAELEGVSGGFGGAPGAGAATVSLRGYVDLLTTVRPRDFGSFRNFVRWRRGVAATLSSVLRQAVVARWAGPAGASARGLLAGLAGALRRLDVRDQEEYDEAGYAAAAEAVARAADAVASACADGWAFGWLLRASIADRLLSAAFDPVAEAEYVPESEELVRLLKARVWPALRVGGDTHLALYAWVHYRQYVLSQEGRLLDGATAIVKALQGLQRKTIAAARSGVVGVGEDAVAPVPGVEASVGSVSGSVPSSAATTPRDGGGVVASGNHAGRSSIANSTTDNPITTVEDEDTPSPTTGLSLGATRVLECLSSNTMEQLGDYHAAVGSQAALARLLALAQTVRQALDATDGLPAELLACVRGSIAAELRRRARAASASGASESAAAAALAAGALELIRTEARAYSPLLLPLAPSAREEAARALHEAFGASFLPWIQRVDALDKQTLQALRVGMALEEFLRAETRAGGAPERPWNLAAYVEPLLLRWCGAQAALLRDWVRRIVAGEDWRAHGKQPGHGARSTTEALKAASETLDGLFALGMAPLAERVVRGLCEGVDAALVEYANAILSGIPPTDTIRPPRPALTRFKREVVAAEEQAELAAGDGARARGPRDVEGIMAASYERLVLRGSACLALLDGLRALQRQVVERWSRAEAAGVAGVIEGGAVVDGEVLMELDLGRGNNMNRPPPNSLDWAQHLFAQTRERAERGVAAACEAVACRLVHGELRPALQEVDRVLGLCCAAAHEALPGRLAWSVYVELLAALEQVLLDGGPLRLFVPDDVDVLEADLAALQALFHADADGLDMEDVERAAEGLGAVLDAMALETPVLVANYKQALAASGRPLARAATAGPAAAHLAAALDPDVLLRVLCHRAEHAASKFLKGLKIGKQLPLTVQGQASEALQKVRSKAPSGGGLLRGFSRSSSTTSGGGSKATPAAPSRFGPAPSARR
ncbi:hypothetical protein QBZ16_003207 [Prototheca wickerhamii]|uniref:MHD2 domain-containing protein n=1 Tax=Prototheca wickerhamii TaxID=3111 RepID=A0AAD9ILF1_PROWI|nr:hypothetical protein QBZ16_003207 [Prototheca wickerhamii]